MFAQALVATPRQTEGPFYPIALPLDTDNDLVVLSDRLSPAVGEVTHLSGRVLDLSGSPVRNATVEIWQVDAHGVYLHPRSAGSGRRDESFQVFSASRPPRTASTASAPSSRCRIPAARRTSTSR